MFYVYVLRSSKTGHRYVGSCENIDERIRRHNAGHSSATRHDIPGTLVHRGIFASRTERFYKTGRGRDELDRFA
jgi:predicted GIY-YIG superfamily endonuclease